MRSLRALLLSACAGLAACGDEKEPTDDNTTPATPSFCDAFTFAPCGGSIGGSWDLQQSCPAVESNSQAPVDSNTACTTSLVRTSLSGFAIHAEFMGDGSYSVATTRTTTRSVNVEQACADAISGAPADLAAYCSATQNGLEADFPGATCSVTGSSCLCTGQQLTEDVESGSYVTSGNSFTKSPSGTMNQIDVPYCVDGDQLAVGEHQYAYVFTRQ